MPNPRYIATVKAGGKVFTGWKSVMVRREFGDTISYFQLTCSEGKGDVLRLVPGTPVQILLGGALALTGAVTTRIAAFDANSHDLIIGGRSGTYAAADSSINIKPGNYNGSTLEQAARAELQPHGIRLQVVNPPAIISKPFRFLAVNPGETVNMFIERMARMRGTFMWDDVQGRMCVGNGNPGAAPIADLQEGRNILRATFKLDDQSIFSSTSIYGQAPSTDDTWAARTAQATASDPSAKDNRIKILPAPHVGDSQDMQAAANLEAARSAWPSVEAAITVAGWFAGNGQLWDILNNVSVYSPMGLPNTDAKMKLGIQALTFAQDGDAGTTTTLNLVKPEFLTSMPHANVQTDGSGGFVDNPRPAVVVPPDWSSQGGIGHSV